MRVEAATQSLLSDRTKEEKTWSGRTLRAPFYLVCSALFCAIALSGLFLGYLMRGSVGALVAGGEPILHGSYLGLIVEVLRGSISLPHAESTELSALLPVFLYFMVYALAIGVLVSILLTVLTCVRKRSARFYCTLNGFLVLFLYGVLCVAAVLLGSLKQEIYSWRQLDLPSLAAVLLAFGVFSVMSIARRGARGVLNVFLLLVNALSVCAFIFPQTPLLSDLNLIASPGIGDGKRILMGFYLIVTIANLILSVLRLERPRTQAVDIFRFAVQFGAALGLTAAYLAEGSIADFFMNQPLASIFLLLSPLCAMLVSVFARTFGHSAAEKKAPTVIAPAVMPETAEAPEPAAPETTEVPEPTAPMDCQGVERKFTDEQKNPKEA